MSEGRAFATLALFVFGILGGVALHAIVDRGPADNPYPSLPKVDEPAVARDIVGALAAGDARTLARLLTTDQLQALDAALQPVVDIRSTKFVGAVESEGRLLSGYTVSGKTEEGIDFIVGFVLRVSNDQVVGVN